MWYPIKKARANTRAWVSGLYQKNPHNPMGFLSFPSVLYSMNDTPCVLEEMNCEFHCDPSLQGSVNIGSGKGHQIITSPLPANYILCIPAPEGSPSKASCFALANKKTRWPPKSSVYLPHCL